MWDGIMRDGPELDSGFSPYILILAGPIISAVEKLPVKPRLASVALTVNAQTDTA